MARKNAQPRLLTAVVTAGALAVAGAPAAAAAQHITATPKTVKRTAIQTVRGSGWPVIEFCSRTVRVSVRSAQNSAPIAQRHIGDNGRFTFRWIPKNKNVGRGDWTMVARMRCESGKDGSTHFLKATTQITIN
jgi:hypothetical protein